MHISYMISQVRDQGAEMIEATAEGEQMWVDEMLDKSKLGERFRAECTPGYYNNEGQPKNAQWPPLPCPHSAAQHAICDAVTGHVVTTSAAAPNVTTAKHADGRVAEAVRERH